MYKAPRIITNRARDNLFRPMSSAVRGAYNPTYLEHWTANVPPKVIGKFRRVDANAGIVYSPALWVPIAQVSFPFAMPCCVITSCWIVPTPLVPPPPIPPDVRPAGRLPLMDRRAVTVGISGAIAAPPAFQGAFLLEWGLGEAHYYTYLDLAEQKINIPICSSVTISAQIPRVAAFPAVAAPPTFVNASILPGVMHPAPYATHSLQYYVIQNVAGVNVTWPFTRKISAHIYSTAVGASAEIQILPTAHTGSVPIPMAQYLLQPAIIGNPRSRPYDVAEIPVPPGSQGWTINIVNPAGNNTSLNLAQIIEP